VSRRFETGGRHWVKVSGLVLLSLLLFLLMAWAIYTLFTSHVEIAVWDFHSPWLALRLMLREGRNPYGEYVTSLIQQQKLGREARPDEDQQAFAYPLHLVVLMGPLAVLPLAQAQALWFSFLILCLILFIFVAPRAVGWRPPTWLMALTAFFLLFWYSTVWAFILGQVAIAVGLFVAFSWWGARTGRWWLAGIALALTTIKPQVVFLFVPALVGWAIYRRAWRLLLAFGGSMLLLVLLPLLWLPTWPLEWVASLRRYAGYTPFQAPLVGLLGSGRMAFVLLLLIVGIVGCCRSRAGWPRLESPDWLLGVALAAGALVAPRSSHVNQLALVLPLLFLFKQLPQPWILLIELGLLAGVWGLDWLMEPGIGGWAHTMWQHHIVNPILPVGLMFGFLVLGFKPCWRSSDA